MTRFPSFTMFACALVLTHATVSAAPAVLPAECNVAIKKAKPDWRRSVAPQDAAQWATERGFNPVVARGDFDGDGNADYATLGSSSGAVRLAVCMNHGSGVSLLIVEKPYCTDLVYRSAAKSTHYNFNTGRDEVIQHDGISVSCFEKAGATYVYEKKALREIVDSD